jgi:hypothetical protein
MLCGARRRRLAALAALFAVVASLSSGGAWAHGGSERPLSTVPPAPPGDGAKAEQILREIAQHNEPEPPADGAQEAQRKPDTALPSGGATAKVVAEPVGQAKRALARAHGARASGDTAHARMFDALALEWAETARALLRAAKAEAAAAEVARRGREVETQLERARALLEETQARRGRAAAELDRLEADARGAAKSAATAEQERIDAARKAGAKATKPADKAPAPVKGATP